jgi:hypothetical protein
MLSRRSRKRALLFSTVVAIASLGGCALVIDLGDEPTLRPPQEAAAVTDTNAPDSGSTDAPVEGAPAVEKCGLPGSSNPVCRQCIEERCCEISKACAADKECAQGLECIKDCMAQVACILGCAPGNIRLDDLKTCSSFQCTTCSPGPECADLGECATLFGDAGEEGLLRAIARGVVLDVDEAKCRSQRENLGNYKKDAEACTHP